MSKKLSINKILLVVDGTESGIRAARYAAKLAALHSANLIAIAVVDTVTLKSLLKSSFLVEAEMAEFDEELGTSAQANLNYAAQLAADVGVTAELHLEKGSAHSVIINQARTIAPDILVMGSFSTSMIKRDLSARERRLIVDEVKCTILLVP